MRKCGGGEEGNWRKGKENERKLRGEERVREGKIRGMYQESTLKSVASGLRLRRVRFLEGLSRISPQTESLCGRLGEMERDPDCNFIFISKRNSPQLNLKKITRFSQPVSVWSSTKRIFTLFYPFFFQLYFSTLLRCYVNLSSKTVFSFKFYLLLLIAIIQFIKWLISKLQYIS